MSSARPSAGRWAAASPSTCSATACVNGSASSARLSAKSKRKTIPNSWPRSRARARVGPVFDVGVFDDPRLALLLVVVGLILGLLLARFLRGARSRARNRIAGEGESEAEAILARAGYKIVARQA